MCSHHSEAANFGALSVLWGIRAASGGSAQQLSHLAGLSTATSEVVLLNAICVSTYLTHDTS